MKIYEEFLSRHKCEEKILHHVHLGYVFFRKLTGDKNNGRLSWRVFEIRYHKDEVHPSTYRFSWYVPSHSLHDVFSREDSKDVAWDAYESELKQVKMADGYTPIFNRTEIFVTLWEMFVYNHEETIPCNSLVANSIDIEKPISERLAAIDEIMYNLSKKSDPLFNKWVSHYAPVINNYVFWLNTIVK